MTLFWQRLPVTFTRTLAAFVILSSHDLSTFFSFSFYRQFLCESVLSDRYQLDILHLSLSRAFSFICWYDFSSCIPHNIQNLVHLFFYFTLHNWSLKTFSSENMSNPRFFSLLRLYNLTTASTCPYLVCQLL